MMRALIVMIAATTLAACSTSLPISGKMLRSEEPLTGSISGSGYRNGTGELTIVTNARFVCKGSFVYTSRRRGEGVLNCDDGRTGAFHIAGVGTTGSGTGDIAGQRFTFVFEDTH